MYISPSFSISPRLQLLPEHGLTPRKRFGLWKVLFSISWTDKFEITPVQVFRFCPKHFNVSFAEYCEKCIFQNLKTTNLKSTRFGFLDSVKNKLTFLLRNKIIRSETLRTGTASTATISASIILFRRRSCDKCTSHEWSRTQKYKIHHASRLFSCSRSQTYSWLSWMECGKRVQFTSISNGMLGIFRPLRSSWGC